MIENIKRLPSKTFFVFFFLLLASEIYVLGEPTILYPYGRDQASTAYVGHIWLQGGIPYKDAVEVRPPANYIPYMAAEILFGYDDQSGIRILDLGLIYFTAFALFLIGTEMGTRGGGIFAAFLFPLLYYAYFDYWHSSQMDGWQAGFITFSIYFYLLSLRNYSKSYLFVSGILMGISFLFKFTSGLLAVVLFNLIIIDAINQAINKNKLIKNLSSFSAGVLLPIFLTIFYFYVNDAFYAMKEVFVDFVIRGYAQQPLIKKPVPFLYKMFSNIFVHHSLWIILALLGIMFSLSLNISNGETKRKQIITLLVKQKGFILVWLLFSAIFVIWQGKYYLYHWLVSIPPIALIAGTGIYYFFQLLAKLHALRLKIVFIIVCAFPLLQTTYPLFSKFAEQRKVYNNYKNATISPDEYYKKFKGPHGYNYFEAYQIGRYIKEHTSPDDSILVGGFNPTIYVVSNRNSPIRFYNLHLITRYKSPVKEQWSEEYRKSIVKSSALKYIAVPRRNKNFINFITKDFFVFEKIKTENGWISGKLFGESFHKEKQIGKWAIYSRPVIK